MKKALLLLASALLMLILAGCAPQLILLGLLSSAPAETPVATRAPVATAPVQSAEPAPVEAEPGEVLLPGSYFEVADVTIEYTGSGVIFTNGRDDLVRIFGSIVGVKADGEQEYLSSLDFAWWDDEAQYSRDLEENGWAVMHKTNLLHPGESVEAELFPNGIHVSEDAEPGEALFDLDVDGDGAYDVIFRISPQPSEDSLVVSTGNPVSDIYRLRVSDFEDKITRFD